MPKLKSLDLSFCSAVSDDGVAAVAEKCTNLEYLNVAGLHRVTDSAARHVTHNLWKLRTLNLEDLHLVTDAIFHFDAVRDGRIAASQNMLSHLAELRAAWKSTSGLGGPRQTSKFSSSVTSKSIRLIWTNRLLSSSSRSTAKGSRIETVAYAHVEVGSKM